MRKLSINKEDYSDWYSKNKKDFPNIFEALKKFNLSIGDYHSQVFDIVNPKDYLTPQGPTPTELRDYHRLDYYSG